MPHSFNLQMYAEAAGADAGSFGDAAATAGNPMSDGMAAGGVGDQIATGTGDQTGEESWDSLIGKGGRYEKEYKAAVKSAVQKRFKNQQDLSGRVQAINPIVQHLAKKYKIQANPDGSIPIDKLSNAVLYDDDALRDEAYERGMSVETLRKVKQLEAQNEQLRAAENQMARDREWNEIETEANQMKELYPDFDLGEEMTNPSFMSLMVSLRTNGFGNPVQTAYEIMHRDEINSGMMEYATRRATQKVAASVRSGKNRPREGAAGASAAGGSAGVDPSKFTLSQIREYMERAAGGERIAF